MSTLVPALVTGVSPLLVVLFTWLTRRGLDRRAAEAKEQVDMLTQQRENFTAVLQPLQNSLQILREDNHKLQDRVVKLSKAVRAAERKANLLEDALEEVLRHLDVHYGDNGPLLDPRVSEILKEL